MLKSRVFPPLSCIVHLTLSDENLYFSKNRILLKTAVNANRIRVRVLCLFSPALCLYRRFTNWFPLLRRCQTNPLWTGSTTVEVHPNNCSAVRLYLYVVHALLSLCPCSRNP